jgi:hypothetical protein
MLFLFPALTHHGVRLARAGLPIRKHRAMHPGKHPLHQRRHARAVQRPARGAADLLAKDGVEAERIHAGLCIDYDVAAVGRHVEQLRAALGALGVAHRPHVQGHADGGLLLGAAARRRRGASVAGAGAAVGRGGSAGEERGGVAAAIRTGGRAAGAAARRAVADAAAARGAGRG